ncbi:DUF3089 family protein [Sinobacterium caligoides]|uniref:DUF3089 family protein n=1 Tax=Sinobacterium caligoides TaxID=933926 RepID=A0A3N2E0C9_9GAMM|nr:DUF3089 domain-containing protein [Sinobacterium caligoides]ROS05159.1 DUF3089 family protein [Sinobacterium caligoides]
MKRYKAKMIIKGFLALLCTIGLLWFFAGTALLQYATTPQGQFEHEIAPEEPNYHREDSWAALPLRQDAADVVPQGSFASDAQADAAVDVFFIHPTSYFLNRWVAPANDWLASLILDIGILPMQASAFNGVAKVYAPHYRQVSMGAQMQEGHQHQLQQALALAYTDVQRAFDYYLTHYNHGRPFIIASHSQGTKHGVPLLNYLYQHYPEQSKRLVAAYLIGNTVVAEQLPEELVVCQSSLQTACYLSWNTMREGGDPSYWLAKGKPVCVNPLSWREDERKVMAEHHLGAIPIADITAIEAPDIGLVEARCEGGMLWVNKPQRPGYDSNIFQGESYHAYDYNFFYMDIRHNVAERVKAYFSANVQ